MSDSVDSTLDLSRRVRDIVKEYAYRRTDAKSGIKWESFKDQPVVDPATGRTRINVPAAYAKARENVCQDAFLRMRACRSREDFVAYFTGTICQVPQYLPPEEYQLVAQALLGEGDEWERVKALSMLALSGLSRE